MKSRALHFAWLALLLFATPVLAQSVIERLITPGPLASAHAKLESKCDSCHSTFRREAQNAKCTACHKGIGADIASRQGYHGKSAPARSQPCKTCHSEHKGRGYPLVRLDRASFDHAFTDFPLAGGHKTVSCSGCHGSGNHFRGAATTCAGCHKASDPHHGKLGSNCQACHSVAGWKQVASFDHSKTGFALSGAHRQVGCLSCHTGQRWAGTPTTCNACHASDDVHHGSRGTNCAGCHTTTAWRAVTFDHSSTGFPLIGAHAAAACTDCHGPRNTIAKPSVSCNSCHAKDDVHHGQVGTQCAQCHNPRAWQQVQFDHNRLTKFPLLGGHRSASCAACHQPKLALLKPATTCISCHAADDKHKGGNGTDCERCHTTDSWKAVTFNHDKMTRFPLDGKHALAKCEACHVKPADQAKLPVECGSCHAKDDVHAGKLGADCARCHDTTGWKDKVRFDHDLTRFPLLGKHAQVQCQDCHADRSFAAKGITCADCHADDHHKGALGTPSQCRDCHNAVDWKAWSFNHDTATRFTLTGAHKGLICAACHSKPENPAKLGTRCVDCHRRDDIHHGDFGEECERCHVTDDFSRIILPGTRN